MTTDQKKVAILASIASRGWSLVEVHFNAGRELEQAGLVKRADRYFTGGNRRTVWVEPTVGSWEEDRWIECGGGIHHFLTRTEAEAY